MKIPHPDINKDSFALYVHIPFCMSKCPYCDFNSFATTKDELNSKEGIYVDALVKEFKSQVATLGLEGRKCNSVFFGGGTPSYLSAESVDSILKNIFSRLDFEKDLEVTLEANPMSFKEELSIDKFKGFKEAGVNRLSFGAQSLRSDKLKLLGRWHEPEDVRMSVLKARECGFTNISCDFISATKLDSEESWLSELQEIVKLETNHLSAYLLTIEPGTQFGIQSKKGSEFTCSEEEASKIYRVTQDFLENAGYVQYEISNYAKPDSECAHNLLYWRGGEYLGIGAGAHSHILKAGDSCRWANTPSPEIYQNRIKKEGRADQVIDSFKVGSKESELLLLRLRLREGMLIAEYPDLAKAYRQGKLDYLFKEGFLEVVDDRVVIPSNKFILADSVISELAALI